MLKNNKQKTGKLAEATRDLGDDKKEESFGLQNAIKAMEKSISGRNSETIENDRNDEQRLSNLESDLLSSKEDALSARDKLDKTLKFLVPK